jgi:membrane-bound lytic murein transglycosylase D
VIRHLSAAAAALLLVLTSGPARALNPFLGQERHEALPLPESLEPNVAFWTRIYSQEDTGGGLIHDSSHLGVVYEAIQLPRGVSSRARERHVTAVKKGYRAILTKLATGRRTGLSAKEKRVLALWPEGVANATLRKARRDVRFQLGQADKFRDGLVRSGAWRRYIQQVLEERGLPLELVALPHVESSYNPRAYSRVGAAGMWQFTRSTGRRYLRVDHVVDERLDPYRATVAAARLLGENHKSLGTWPLALTSYNHGASGMRRAVRKLGTHDIGVIVKQYRSRTFGFASRNFYASFLAAVEVDRNARRYFGKLALDEPEEFETFALDHYYPAGSLERALGIDRASLQAYNPALRPAVWQGSKYMPRGYELRLPRASLPEPAEMLLARIPDAERFSRQHRDRYYKVRRGDSLSKIASRYGVRESELMALNNLRSRHRIRAGQVLILPDRAGGRTTVVAREERPSDGVYRVRRGDNLTIIARRFGTTESELASLNRLRNRNHLVVGQRLRLTPAPEPVVVAAVQRSEAPKPAPAGVQPPPVVENSNGNGAHATPPEPVVVAAVASQETPTSQPAPPAAEAAVQATLPTPDPSNYAVSANDRVVVQAEETLGHYADWLEIPTGRLRHLNRMRSSTPLVIGRRIRLDFGRVPLEIFEQRRLEYHQELQAEFFAAFIVSGTESYTLHEGDSLWQLANHKFELPIWLLRQYNPDLNFGALEPGASLTVPTVEARKG